MPTVSIVVPTYQREPFLKRMIDSVIAQTYDDWELIIVDGNSDDGTAELVRSYRDSLGDRLVFIEQENQGCCIARNTGIAAARGGFVAFLDSDDEFLPTKLERQMDLFRLRPDLGLVYCDFSYIDLEGRSVESVFDVKTPIAREVPYEVVAPGLHVCTPDLFEHLIKQYFIATIVGVVRREVLADDIRYLPNDMYGCEWLFYLEIARRTRAGYVDEPLCLHHWVDGSLSRTSTTRNLIYRRRLLRTMRKRFADVSDPARREIETQLQLTCQQLGMQSYKEADYARAMGCFSEAFFRRFDLTTGVHFLQSAARWIAALGRSNNQTPHPTAKC